MACESEAGAGWQDASGFRFLLFVVFLILRVCTGGENRQICDEHDAQHSEPDSA